MEEKNTQIDGEINMSEGKNRTYSTPERPDEMLSPDKDKHLQDINSALKPDDEETKYSGQKLDGLSISK